MLYSALVGWEGTQSLVFGGQRYAASAWMRMDTDSHRMNLHGHAIGCKDASCLLWALRCCRIGCQLHPTPETLAHHKAQLLSTKSEADNPASVLLQMLKTQASHALFAHEKRPRTGALDDLLLCACCEQLANCCKHVTGVVLFIEHWTCILQLCRMQNLARLVLEPGGAKGSISKTCRQTGPMYKDSNILLFPCVLLLSLTLDTQNRALQHLSTSMVQLEDATCKGTNEFKLVCSLRNRALLTTPGQTRLARMQAEWTGSNLDQSNPRQATEITSQRDHP